MASRVPLEKRIWNTRVTLLVSSLDSTVSDAIQHTGTRRRGKKADGGLAKNKHDMVSLGRDMAGLA